MKDGRIASVGAVGTDAAEIVDAGGLALMPGIIDLHTHYDAQVTWDPTLSPSPSLGVTSVVMGNCGFGIVPSPPQLRDMIMRNLAVVSLDRVEGRVAVERVGVGQGEIHR